MSEDSTKSSYSSSILNEMHYNISFDDAKDFNNTNDDYLSFSEKNERYWERRRKNNAAAKRSRERRRQHDDELEQEIQRLKLLNSVLQDEILKLQQRINVYESNLINTISSKTSNELNVNNIENFTEIVETLCQNNISNSRYPIDLSCKLSPNQSMSDVVHKVQHKTFNNSNNQVMKDQKYWDRRRRNNEAVRKCRQNKRLRDVNNVKANNKEDKEQIHLKIDSISSELEKLKSHIKHNGNTSVNIPSMDRDTLVSVFENSKYYNTQIIKWKSKLIEADQADNEMF